jgi:hypothetical protein
MPKKMASTIRLGCEGWVRIFVTSEADLASPGMMVRWERSEAEMLWSLRRMDMSLEGVLATVEGWISCECGGWKCGGSTSCAIVTGAKGVGETGTSTAACCAKKSNDLFIRHGLRFEKHDLGGDCSDGLYRLQAMIDVVYNQPTNITGPKPLPHTRVRTLV